MLEKKDTSLKTLYEYLRKFHLSDSLILVGAINSALKYGAKQFWTDGIHPSVIGWLKAHCSDERDSFSIYTGTTRLARFLLLSGANDYRDKSLSLNDQSFAIALNMAGNIYERELERNILAPDLASVLGRTSQWQFPLQSDQAALLGRAYLLFVLLAEQPVSGYSLEQKMREYFNIGTFEFMATGMIIWIKTDGYEYDLIDIFIPGLKKVATEKNQQTFLRLSSGTPEAYRRLIRGNDWKNSNKLLDIYALDPFLAIPAIEIARSTTYKAGGFVIPQPHYLFERASHGMFYLLANKEQALAKAAGNKGQNSFRVEFGFIYRNYVGMQLDQDNSNFDFIDLDNDFNHTSGGKMPDFAIVKNNACILFEVKTTLLNVAARSYYEPEVLESEIKKGVFNKALDQLQSFAEAVLQGRLDDPRFRNIKRVIKVLIGYDDIFVLNTLILPLLNKHYGNKAEHLQLACVSDVDVMGTLVAERRDLVKMIIEKVDSPEKHSYAFIADWEKKASINNPVLRRAYDDLMLRMAGPSV
ncbi:hypothetical protein PQ469_24350 [Mucilaginibacter sp. KACC 22773]|uniref:hypothetical protein n=1 Tax=Mucilaginibacter sp. KACC 22773 TaxID=3025671 RepID=UPI002367303E|nr:hypothetical protein [Mucilaginibacter sp. KACC 22773]WDF77019.1 hypothetical protein PQ469_24350 [Mucilaginibacter sp. KACC 22773]